MRTSRSRAEQAGNEQTAHGPAAGRKTPSVGAAVPPPLTADLLRAVQRGAGNAAATGMIARSARTASAPEQPDTGVREVLRSAGEPLAAPVRQDMEARLGADFSDVRLHTGAAAARSARAIGARAYTSGSHVVIGEGGGDRHTLAHELSHVVQQRRGPVSGSDTGHGFAVSDPGDRFERAAEANASRVMSGPTPVQKSAEDDIGQAGTPAYGRRQQSVQRVVYNTPTAPAGPVPPHPVSDVPAGRPDARTTSIEMITDGTIAGSPPAFDPPGYGYIRRLGLTNFWIRFHLINEQAGGPGTAANLVPASKRDNSRYEKAIESELKDQVDDVRARNQPLQGNAPRHYVYFGVDVSYATNASSPGSDQGLNAPYFVNSLTVHLKRYDPAGAGTWTPTFTARQFNFMDSQPAVVGASVDARAITLDDLKNLGAGTNFDNIDIQFLRDIGGRRNAEFAQLLDKYAGYVSDEAAYYALSEMPVSRQPNRRGIEVAGPPYGERVSATEAVRKTLGVLLATGRIKT